MRITYELLVKYNACNTQVQAFAQLYPDGVEPTIEVLMDGVAESLDSWWLWHLLPDEGPGSKRAYALWCAEQVAHLNSDPQIAQCLKVIRRMVTHQDVSEEQRQQARDAANAAAYAAADAANAAAYAAANAANATAYATTAAAAAYAADAAAAAAAAYAAYAADAATAAAVAREAQLTCLSQLLLEAE